MRSLALAVLVAVGWTAQAGEEVPRYLDAARKLYESLDYERALAQLQRARRFSRGADDDVAIALYEGILLAELGRIDESTSAFREALFLQPDATLPLKVSPKLVDAFERLRAQAHAERRPAAPPPATPPPPAASPPPAAALPAVVPPVLVPLFPGGGLRALSWAPAALGLGLVGGGAWFGVQAKQRADSLDAAQGLLAAQAAAIRDEGKQLQGAAIGLCVGGAASLLVAGAMFLWGELPPARVGLVTAAGGGGLLVQGEWP